VAPDHPEVKSVQSDFTKVASDPRVTFNGNLEVGKDVQLAVLQDCYDAVILAYGASVCVSRYVLACPP
jgi:NADPH-dependent glutamate synthase beta subunit-like oxidoreductase